MLGKSIYAPQWLSLCPLQKGSYEQTSFGWSHPMLLKLFDSANVTDHGWLC